MGTIPMETQKIKLENGRQGKVDLFTTTDDLGRQETDGIYYCIIEVEKKTYSRYFLIKEYNEYHYKNFLKKFAQNHKYRKKWIVEESN